MSVIDDLEELLAGAESRTQSRRIYSRKCLADLAIPIAEELVASQEALQCWHSNTGAGGYDMRGEHPERNCMEAEERPDPDDEGCPGRCKPCTALRLDGLAKAMGR